MSIFRRPQPEEQPQSPAIPDRELREAVTAAVPQPPENVLDGFPITFNGSRIDELYMSLTDNPDGFMAYNVLLAKPVERAALAVTKYGGRLSLYGVVDFKDNKSANTAFEHITNYVTTRNPHHNFEERGGALIVPSGSYNFSNVIAIGKKSGESNSIHVTSGRIKTGYREYADILEEPEDTPERFHDAMRATLGNMAVVLAVSYKELGDTPPPRQVINLKMPQPAYDPYATYRAPAVAPSNIPEDISKKFGVEYPRISFDAIGGQPRAKEEISNLALAIAKPDMYKRWGTKPPKGVLLHGPPGTGKTLLARALASEADAAFYAVTAADITSKWYGGGEKRIREIFETAAKQPRAIIYFDEIDAIVPDRVKGTHEATGRMMSVMLQSIDGIHQHDNVMIVGSTNRLDAIDPAMRRPGRFDRLIPVELPNKQGRSEIFTIQLKAAEAHADRNLFSHVDVVALAEATAGYSGADIAEVIRRVLEGKVRAEAALGIELDEVTEHDLHEEIAKYEHLQAED